MVELDEVIKLMNRINLNSVSVNCGICNDGGLAIIHGDRYDESWNSLLSHGWRYVPINKTLYCPKCYKQYLELNNIGDEVKKKYERPEKIQYYLNIAKEVSSRSTCLRRRYGAIIVKNDSIISTGYNGSPRGTKNCSDMNYCRRDKMGIPRGQMYEMCRAIHAEMNCIINADLDKMLGSTMYLYGVDATTNEIIENLDSCQMCKKIIINAGIETIVLARPDNDFEIHHVSDWIINDETLTDKVGY